MSRSTRSLVTSLGVALGFLSLGVVSTAFAAAPTNDDIDEFAEMFTVADRLNPEAEDDVVLTYPAGSFDPTETVEIYLFPGADLLATTTADDEGGLDEATVTIPAGTDVGGYELVAVDANGNGIVTPITVAADAAPDFNPIDYEQPGQFDLSPCVDDDDTDCIEEVSYLGPNGETINAGYVLDGPADIGFQCTDDHVFQNAGNYWNFPGLSSETEGSVLLVNPSLTTPNFNHDCWRDGDRVNTNELVAEKLFVSLYAAGNSSPYGQMLIGEPRTDCPETPPHTSTECMRRAGPGEGNQFSITMRVSGFAAAYAFASTQDTNVVIEPLETGGSKVTLSGSALGIPGVWDQESFDEGSLRTADQADFLEQMWFFQLRNANDPGFPSACAAFGFPVISGNHAWGGEPTWDNSNSELVFNMGAPHLAPDGEPFQGVYEARIPVDYAECLWGIDPASLVTDLEVAVVDEDGTERAEGEFEASITIVGDMLHIDADSFHFSEPDVVVRSTGGFVNLAEPVRILDTRSGDPVGADDLGGDGDPYTLQVTGDTIPTGATAAALNVTVVNGQANDFGGYVSVYPCGTLPEVSNLNFVTGQTIPNSVLAPLSDDGEVCLYVYGQAHLLVDVSGYL